MDEAALAVFGSITAALLGAIVGATINGRTVRTVERARETREQAEGRAKVRAAARLVFTDLEITRLSLRNALNTGKVSSLPPPTTAWGTHGVLLARALPPDDYDPVAEACAKVAVWASGIGIGWPSAGGLSDLAANPDLRPTLENLLGMCTRANEILHPVAYPAND